MERLIDADAATQAIQAIYCNGCNNYNGVRCRACDFADAMSVIDDTPTIDAEPVRHGEWLFVELMESDYETEIAERCSLCGRFVHRYQGVPKDNFCPNCGAKMDGGEKSASKEP